MPQLGQSGIPFGPIPGAAHTSDTKNYPWHRPPDITTLDEGIATLVKQLTSSDGVNSILDALSTGLPVSKLATSIVTSGVGAGKWTVDYAILLAGPCAKLVQTIADAAKIKYTMGINDAPRLPLDHYKAVADQTNPDVSGVSKLVNRAVPGIEKQAKLVMAGPKLIPDDNSGNLNTAKSNGGGFMSKNIPGVAFKPPDTNVS